MAIPHFKAQIIKGSEGRNVVAAAAYRHRATIFDELAGRTWRYEGKTDLVHSELAIPDNAPIWLRELYAQSQNSVATASGQLWNRVIAEERQINGQQARDFVIALPIELSKSENIALMRDFVERELTSKGMIVDWVYHDQPGNPHVHLMHTLRPAVEEGFGKKKIPILDQSGQPLRVNGKIVYKNFTGYKDELKVLRSAWGETANRHLALAGFETRIDMRSFAERGIDMTPTSHLGVAVSAIFKKTGHSFIMAEQEMERVHTGKRILDNPSLVLQMMSQQQSTFTEQDIAKVIHRFVDDYASFIKIQASVMTSPELVALRRTIVDPTSQDVLATPVYSTRETIRIEHEMALNADRLVGKSGFAVSEHIVIRSIAAVENKGSVPFRFDDEQRDAVLALTRDQGIAALVGFAGAGKSTLLEAARLAWESEGRTVIGGALAGKAAEGLQNSSGIASFTLASLELSWSKGLRLLNKGDILVVDEAGMVSSRQMARVIETVERAGAKIVLVGDAMQLQPIEAGAAFRSITDRIGYVELVGVRRQIDDWAQEASRQFARGQTSEALKQYQDHGRIRMVGDSTKAVEAIVSDWMTVRNDLVAQQSRGERVLIGSEQLILAYRNSEVLELNTAVRQALIERGTLQDGQEFKTARGKRDFTVGDRLLFLQNARFTESSKPDLGEQAVKNGMLGTVLDISNGIGSALLTVRLDGGREVSFKTDTYDQIDHGYAKTIHKSQGTTVEHSFVLASASMDQHLTYVAMSRHKESVTLYAPKSEWRSFEEMAKQLGQSRAKTSTLDFEKESGYRAVIDQFAARRGIETLSSIMPLFKEALEKQIRWIHDKRDQVNQLWQKIEQAIGKGLGQTISPDIKPENHPFLPEPALRLLAQSETVLERGGVNAHHEAVKVGLGDSAASRAILSFANQPDDLGYRVEPLKLASRRFAAAANIIERGVILPSVTDYKESVEMVAHRKALENPHYIRTIGEIADLAGLVWKEPDQLIKDIQTRIENGQALKPLLDRVHLNPAEFGVVRGSDKWLDQFGPLKQEREQAFKSLADLIKTAAKAEETFQKSIEGAVKYEDYQRKVALIPVPQISETTRLYLSEMQQLSRSSFERYENAVVSIPPKIAQELQQFNAAFEARFGLLRANRSDEEIIRMVPENLKEKIKQILPLIKTARNVEQTRANVQQRSLSQARDKGLGITR